MDGFLVMVSGILIIVSGMLITDAIACHRYRDLAIIAAMAVIAGVICFTSLHSLPDPQGYSWYWKAAIPVGIFLMSLLVALAAPTSKRNKK